MPTVLSNQWNLFVSKLGGDAKAALKASLAPVLATAQATALMFNQKLLPINIKITTYSAYVSILRTLYTSTVQAITPITNTFALFDDPIMPKTVTSVAPEMGMTQEAIMAKTDPIYKKLYKAESKLRKMKLEKENLIAGQTKIQAQIDSLQAQINSL